MAEIKEIEFNIQRGLSKELFPAELNGEINPNIIIEDGCWYLCTDTAELFLGVAAGDTVTLKRINADIDQGESIDPEVFEALRAEVNAVKASLAEYAKKSDIPTDYVTKATLGDYALKSDVTGKADIDHTHEEYADKEHTHDEYITGQTLTNYYNKEEVNELIPSLDGYAKTSDIPSLEGYATKDFVTGEIDKIEIPEEYNDAELRNLISTKAASDHTHEEYSLTDHTHSDYLTEQSLDGYATEQFVTEAIETHEGIAKKEEVLEVKTQLETEVLPKVETVDELRTWVENKEYLQDIDLDGYATEEFVVDAIKDIAIPESEIYKVDFNAPDFAAATDAYNNGKFLVLTNAAPDANGYAVMNYVRDDMITFTKFLTSRSEVYGAFNTYYLHSDNTWEVSKEVKLNKVEANVNDEIAGELNSIKIGKEVYSIPSTNGLATEEFVRNEIANIEHPTIDTSNLVTTETLSGLLATKADKVLFTTAKYVKKPIGDFTENENVGGLDLATLFAKLLGLSDTPTENPDTPDTPDESKSIIENIIANEIPMYSIKDYTVSEVPYQLHTYDDTTKNDPITTSGFYQVLDESGSIVEAGYQDVTVIKDDVYYIIALPKFIDYNTMITLQTYDDLNNVWTALDDSGKLVMTNDQDYIRSICAEEPQMYLDDVDTNEYTLWMCEEPPTGSHYRFVINE